MSVIAVYARMDEGSLDACRGNPTWMEALHEGAVPNAEVTDVDKAYDGIVWLLKRVPQNTPSIAGAGFVLKRSLAQLLHGEGGREEPTIEASYGPANWLTAEQVTELGAWLQSVTPDQLRAAYDPSAMQRDEVYPFIWEDEGQEALEDSVLPYYASLQAFFFDANRSGQGVLVYFT
jgi:Domain of unknown function (DUF1877)